MQLRDYQYDAIDRCRQEFASGSQSVCLVLPTGAGKTVIAASIIVEATKRGPVIFLVHRDELLRQSVAKLEAAGINNLRTIQAGNDLGRRDATVIVASIPTLANRATVPDAKFVVIDECHHVAAKTWADLRGRYHSARILGLTATPQRGDGRSLGNAFDAIVVGATPAQLTELGHLVPARIWAPPLILNSGSVALNPLQAYRDHGNGGKAVVFCASIAHAEAVASDMSAGGAATAAVHGKLSGDLRRQRLSDLDSGALTAITSVHALTEGWDCPSASVCVLARKPSHAGLYLQMIGRVLRPAPGKTEARVIDLCGASIEHGPPNMDREYTLEGRGIKKVDRLAISQCLACGAVYARSASCPQCGRESAHQPPAMPTAEGLKLIEMHRLVGDAEPEDRRRSGLCSHKQAKLLSAAGVVDTVNLSSKRASELIAMATGPKGIEWSRIKQVIKGQPECAK